MSDVVVGKAGELRVERLVTSGTFSLDGGTWDVDNNVWILGDDHEVIVVDAPHDADAIHAAVGNRRLKAIVCTHAHDDHVNAAPALRKLADAPIMLNPADRELWELEFPDDVWDLPLSDGQVLEVAGAEVRVIATPGHAPGAVCLSVPALGVVFSGDTLFAGGPGATGRSFSDFPTIIASIRTSLFALPDETVVLTGHGDSTTIGAERPQLDEWIARGH